MVRAMTGDWTGKGWAKQTARGPREAIRCRIQNSYIDESRQLVVKGFCAVPGKRLKMNGTMSSQIDSNNIDGRWSNPFGQGSIAVSGIETNSSIILNITARDPETLKKSEQKMHWTPVANGLDLKTLLTDKKQTQISELTFERR